MWSDCIRKCYEWFSFGKVAKMACKMFIGNEFKGKEKKKKTTKLPPPNHSIYLNVCQPKTNKPNKKYAAFVRAMVHCLEFLGEFFDACVGYFL